MNLKALFNVTYGMYVVSSHSGDKKNGQISNTMFQITAEPPTIAVSINKQNLTHEYIVASGVFTVAVLSDEAPMTYIGQFGFKSGRDIDKFASVEHKVGVTGAPIPLQYALSALEAKVISSLDCGTHTLFVGKLVNAETLLQGTPMTYSFYHAVKGGKSPKNAPTYVKPAETVAPTAAKYKCTVCGHIYDETVGDPDAGIKPGTLFADLPSDWVCPVCGVAKDSFKLLPTS